CLSNAILLYVRATESGNTDRASLQVRQKLTPEELAVHRELVDLRKKAVAHFDRSKVYEGRSWAEETLVLTNAPDMPPTLRVPIRRVMGRALLERGFDALLQKALVLAETM